MDNKCFLKLVKKIKDICKKGEFLSLENEKIWCKTCEEYIKIKENRLLSSVNDQIVRNMGNQKNMSESKQTSLHKEFEASNAQQLRSKDLLFDLTKMMTEVGIYLNKVNRSSFKHSMKKYTEESVPDESTLRKNCVGLVYDEKLALLKEYVAEKRLYFILDETTDGCSRSVLSILVS